MKLIQIFSVFFIGICLTSCSSEDDTPSQEVDVELLTATVGPCEGEPVFVQPGYGEGFYHASMFMKLGSDQWENYPTYVISDFEFEPGYEYELSVEKITTYYHENVPQDSSNPFVEYRLSETTSKTEKPCD